MSSSSSTSRRKKSFSSSSSPTMEEKTPLPPSSSFSSSSSSPSSSLPQSHSSSSSPSPPPSFTPSIGDSFQFKILTRPSHLFDRSSSSTYHQLHRNYDPLLHPHAAAREYTRALNAVKLDKLFSAPFEFALDGHRDGIYTLSTIKKQLTQVVSASADGNIFLWELNSRRHLWSVKGHNGMIRGVVGDKDGEILYSCGQDAVVKAWKRNPWGNTVGEEEDEEEEEDEDEDNDMDDDDDDENESKKNKKSKLKKSSAPLPPPPSRLDNILLRTSSSPSSATPLSTSSSLSPVSTYLGTNAFTAIDSSSDSSNLFVTSGAHVDLWDSHRSSPLHSFDWGVDTMNTVKFNSIETNLLLSSATDRSIVLYDIRTKMGIRKIILNMQTNNISWNPQIPYHFTTASEDQNCYTFDTRKLDHSIAIHEDHINAVMSIDYSPTGREFVSGSYDKTIRIFNMKEGHSKQIYHTKRMQRVMVVKYTLDGNYILSGSDDCNIRIWRANANERGGVKNAKQIQQENYRNKLKSKYSNVQQLRKIQRHKVVPKYISNNRVKKDIMKKSEQKREENRRSHTKEGTVEIVAAKKKAVRKEVE